MKTYVTILALFLALSGTLSIAQSSQPKIIEDFKISSTTQEGKQFPQVNSEGRMRVQISAPEAHKVQLDVSAVK